MKCHQHWFYKLLFISKLTLHNKIISCSVDPGADPEKKHICIRTLHYGFYNLYINVYLYERNNLGCKFFGNYIKYYFVALHTSLVTFKLFETFITQFTCVPNLNSKLKMSIDI